MKNDSYFNCQEFFKYNEFFEIGVIIYKTNSSGFIQNNYEEHYINKELFNYNFKEVNNYNTSIIYNNYENILFETKEKNNLNEMKRLRKLYFLKPILDLKRNIVRADEKWNFANIFNEYFCFCKGSNCLNMKVSNSCKYYFYLHLIDLNSEVYKKTDFLLMDFILEKYSSDDVFPIFEKMINYNLNAHYLTEKKEIYQKYCDKKKYCNSVIYVKYNNYTINDDFLEKHLSLILKLRQVLSSVGVNINFINNIFYNIDYITYICIGHGVSFFKDYLYRSYYGPGNFDKLLIPNSEKLISITKKYGWKEENLIKFNLPRWDKYIITNISLNYNLKINYSNSIFIMFTWRNLKNGERISSFYINNILNLLNNEQLINNLLKYNLTLYFTLHHKVLIYKELFKFKKSVVYIEENEIAECISKTNLIVTDFSSIIFDIIYRRKPYIILLTISNIIFMNLKIFFLILIQL